MKNSNDSCCKEKYNKLGDDDFVEKLKEENFDLKEKIHE